MSKMTQWFLLGPKLTILTNIEGISSCQMELFASFCHKQKVSIELGGTDQHQLNIPGMRLVAKRDPTKNMEVTFL